MILKTVNKAWGHLYRCLMLLFLPLALHAQSKIRPSLSLEYLIPVKESENSGIGTMLNLEWFPNEKNWGFRLTTGAAFSVTTNEYKRSVGYIPLKLAMRLMVLPRFYIGVGVGAAFGFNDYGSHLLTGVGAEYRFTKHWAYEFSFEDTGYRFLVPRLTYLF